MAQSNKCLDFGNDVAHRLDPGEYPTACRDAFPIEMGKNTSVDRKADMTLG